ncbi:MAG: Protoporphyrinogen oxidase, aerobic, HemY [Labilithrix sp.]|nr:Protoporphyrinogen oxidase, aerobic, HemY [Labilithrix sp.]
MKRRVVIVGGGITGLATAYALEKATEPSDVHILEAAPRLGGNLVTVNHNGFTIDGGPDSWVATKPHATRLAKAVGLGDELIGTRPDTRKVYIVWKKQLHAMPEGLVLGIPTEWRPFASTELFGLDAKLRALLEPIIPRKIYSGDEDESIASFVSRRLGPDICDRIAGPLLGGIFAGDPEQLSVRACVPQLVEAEAKYGSLISAMRVLRAARKEQTGGEGEASTFLSLKRGIGDLVTYVAHRLRDAEISTGCAATRVSPLEEGDSRGLWAVETSTRGTLYADHVALTLPAHASAGMVGGFDPALARMLGAMSYVSTATVFLAYRKYDVRHPLDAAGFLVPKSENRPILACTFVSSKWDHRAPSGQALLRVFIGGAGGEHHLEHDDEGLARLAREQLYDLLGIERAPVFTRVFRFKRASPQPTVGHLGRMRRLLAQVATWRGLHVGGNGFIGTGIPDSIKQGEEIAAGIAGVRATLAPSERVTADGTTPLTLER